MLFGAVAIVIYLLDYLLIGLGAHTTTWFSGVALLALGSLFAVLQLVGAEGRIRR